jgi:hypothetical protein
LLSFYKQHSKNRKRLAILQAAVPPVCVYLEKTSGQTTE